MSFRYIAIEDCLALEAVDDAEEPCFRIQPIGADLS